MQSTKQPDATSDQALVITDAWIRPIVAAIWCLGCLLFWCWAVLSQASPIESSALTALALAAVFVSLAIRFPLLRPEPVLLPTTMQCIELMGVAANLNLLGWLTLRADSIQAALPALIVVAMAELAMQLLVRYRLGFWPCMTRTTARWFAEGIVKDNTPPAKTDHVALAAVDVAPSTWSEKSTWPEKIVDATVSPQSLGIGEIRRTTEGRDDSGQRFLAGEILVELATDQRAETVLVGFCPAFRDTPHVELECEVDGVDVRIASCTAIGMRIALKCSRQCSESEFLLNWYATEEAELAPDSTAKRFALP
ncbi:MAG: NADH-quinone oxidoreductase subunit K [Planctomycetales bacterium]|nr:NADH-quinone oxidoreductase subunit K [Planctomycetales bacterium]